MSTKGQKGPTAKQIAEQEKWIIRRARGGVTRDALRNLLAKQNGCCAMSGVKLLFGAKEGTYGETGCHPLYAAVDHLQPGNDSDLQIVCIDLKELKGQLSKEMFNALKKSRPWQKLMEDWRKQEKKNPKNKAAFKQLIHPKNS